MASQTFAGTSIPCIHYTQAMRHAPAFSATLTIDATGEKAAFSGRVFFAARTGTKDIRKVGIRFGAVTKAGGSALTISLQNVLNGGAGGPMLPDETQDQTVAVANANAAFVSNTWLQSGNLSADRTVSFGDLLSIVIEYDGGGRLGADSVVISGPVATDGLHQCVSALKTGGTWATTSVIPNVILEFSDGTFGTLTGAFPCSDLNTITYNSGSGADEYALEFSFPGPVKVDAAGGYWLQVTTGDAEVIFYDGTSAMTNGTAGADGDYTLVAGSARDGIAQMPGMVTLAANTTYRLAFKPTSTNNVQLSYFDVAAAGHLQAHVGGTGWAITSRVDGGSWAAPTATRRPFLWPYICAIGDDASSGGINAPRFMTGGLT